MTDSDRFERSPQRSRRTVLKAGGVATVASLLGFSGSAMAQEGGDGGDGSSQDGMTAWLFNDEVRPGSVFRVASPELADQPNVNEEVAGALPSGSTTRIIEYFNTAEEATMLLPSDSDVQEGELYQFTETMQFVEGGGGEGLVRAEFRPVQTEDFPFDLSSNDDVEILDEGGEGAVRPRNFSAGSIFRVTSGEQGWVPDDVAQSGYFTEYNTRHAEYLGTDDEFLFFPQEDAEVETDALYTVEEEWELFDPVGNLVAVEFSRVEGDSLPVDDEFL